MLSKCSNCKKEIELNSLDKNHYLVEKTLDFLLTIFFICPECGSLVKSEGYMTIIKE